MQSCLEPLGQHSIDFSAAQCYLEGIKTTLDGIFLIQCCVKPYRQHCIWFWLVQCCFKNIKPNCTGFFLIQCSTEPLRQHCIGFSPVEFFPKSIQTTFQRNLSYGKSSEAFWVTLHKVFTRAIYMYVKFI